MFHLAPLLLLALAVWLDRGLPRPPRLSALAALVPAALVLTFPLQDWLNSSLVNDTFGLLPFLRFAAELPGGVNDLRILIGAGAIAAGLVFVGLPRRAALGFVPAALAAYLVASSSIVFEEVHRVGVAYRYAPSVGADANWVDRTIGEGGSALFVAGAGGDPAQARLIEWQTDFFNESVEGAYAFGTSLLVDPATGSILAADSLRPPPAARHALVPRGVQIAGELLVDRSPLALYRIDPPLRLASETGGVFPDGWMGADASYVQYAFPEDGPGRVEVGVARTGWSGPDVPGDLRIEVGPLVVADGGPGLGDVTATRTWVIHSKAQKVFELPTPPPPFRVQIHVEPTFSPAEFGLDDPRQLGAQVSFRYVAGRA